MTPSQMAPMLTTQRRCTEIGSKIQLRVQLLVQAYQVRGPGNLALIAGVDTPISKTATLTDPSTLQQQQQALYQQQLASNQVLPSSCYLPHPSSLEQEIWPTASSSRPPNSTVTQQSGSAAQTQSSSQANAAVSSPTAPSVVANTTSSANLHATINYPTRWTHFWLFVCQSLTLSGILNLQGQARKQARHVWDIL
ncbi:hypothetical protein CY34DRAFT_15458 [Suillus luteus UH-Slu-Lm8-n1]|uniref:Uncharacterized protein n=1 Tax=Suillus luteus UH-Slu-Lm8-n1 TaxID=930992 RepID=A0A0D0A820_9AGAM|nr:hypothetical protein CY34DRAFT_15458 [Suillus luteus UH-Slu-Lm8-n1]